MTVPVRTLVVRCTPAGDDPQGVDSLEGGGSEAVVV